MNGEGGGGGGGGGEIRRTVQMFGNRPSRVPWHWTKFVTGPIMSTKLSNACLSKTPALQVMCEFKVIMI